MTLTQTRQLGIEFERRVQTILPATESIAKLDTETIYSFLNQYQQKYVHDMYKGFDRIDRNTRLETHVEKTMQCMLKEVLLGNNEEINSSNQSKTYIVPSDYQMYVQSTSNVNSTFNWKGKDDDLGVLPNIFMSQKDVLQILQTPYDKLRILRNPIVVFPEYSAAENSNLNKAQTITVVHDRYTNIKSINLVYYKNPAYFDIMTSTPCELPMDCFDDLVTGAVELYISYVRGGIRQLEEDGRRERAAQRQAEREAERERKNNNE